MSHILSQTLQSLEPRLHSQTVPHQIQFVILILLIGALSTTTLNQRTMLATPSLLKTLSLSTRTEYSLSRRSAREMRSTSNVSVQVLRSSSWERVALERRNGPASWPQVQTELQQFGYIAEPKRESYARNTRTALSPPDGTRSGRTWVMISTINLMIQKLPNILEPSLAGSFKVFMTQTLQSSTVLYRHQKPLMCLYRCNYLLVCRH